MVASGDLRELLDFTEEVFGQVPFLVRVPVEVSWATAVPPGRDHGSFAGGGERLEHAFVGIEAFVGNQEVGLHAAQEVIAPREIVRLSSGQQERSGLPRESTKAWILALSPPRERPIA